MHRWESGSIAPIRRAAEPHAGYSGTPDRLKVRTRGRIFAMGLLACTLSCGESPVYVEEDTFLIHEELGFTIGLPQVLVSSGWEIRAETDVSVYDASYHLAFLSPPDEVSPALSLDAMKVSGRLRPTADEWIESLHIPPSGAEPWVACGETVNVLDRWPEVVEVVTTMVAPDHSAAVACYGRYVASGKVQLQIGARLLVPALPGETQEQLLAKIGAHWTRAVPRYRQISDTLRLH